MTRNLQRELGEAQKKLSTRDPIEWIEEEFYIPETRHDPVLHGRIQLVDYQRDVLKEALSRDEKGNYKYSIIIWSDIKKSGKSSIAAAVNLSRAEATEWGEFYVVANDLKQADSRVNHYIRRAIQLNPRLKGTYSRNGYRITAPCGAYIEAIPIDPSGEAGSNADMITFSELWGANESAKQNMWAEMTIPPNKRGQAFRWIESYAGFAEEAELLYSLYELGVKQGRMLWPDKLYPVTDGVATPLEVYVNEEAGMLCLWNTQPRCPWQTKEYYSSEEKILHPNQFRRMHRNQWVSSTDTFIPIEWWDACKRNPEEWPKLDDKRTSHIVALDAAISGDCFAVWMGCRHPELPNDIVVRYAQIWKPKPGQKLDFQGTDENPGPEKVLRRLIKDYNIVQVTYDPYQLHDMATRLKSEGLAWFRAFPQERPRLLADSQLRDLIRDRRIWHQGEPDLREHLNNANAEIDPQDHKMRLVKRTDKMKIDLAVDLSMGTYELLRLNL